MQTAYDVDLENFRQAMSHFSELSPTEANWKSVRLYLIAEKKAVKAGFMGIPTDLYVAAIAALRPRLEKIEAPKPGYRPRMIFDPDEDNVRKEPAPLPESAADPWIQQKRRDEEQVLDNVFAEFYGRKLTSQESLMESKRKQATQRPDAELRDPNVIVYAGQLINRAATARARKEAEQHNAAVLAARKSAKVQGGL
jgi:hypothetical protein